MRSLLALVAVALFVGAGVFLRYAWLASGFAAKTAGSAVFVAQRPLADVRAGDIAEFGMLDVALKEGAAEAGLWGLFTRRAIHRPGLGVTLVIGDEGPDDVTRVPRDLVRARRVADGDLPRDTPASPGMRAALDLAFERETTRAVVVRHRDRIVAERYAPDTDATTPILGWSIAKSVLAAMAGVIVERTQLDVDAPLNLWPADDPRAAITADHLLRMSSGLAFDETYTNPFADAPRMLFAARSMADYTAALPLEHPVDSHFSYASGTSNLLAAYLADRVGGAGAFLDLADEALFDPLGMWRSLWEVDASGMPVGSSYVHATARGWSRFGQLHLDGGVWRGERLLPEGWVEWVTTPTPTRSNYGRHWWLNRPRTHAGGRPMFPSLPAGTFSAQGYAGQYVVVIPSRDVVIVRLGTDVGPRFAFDAFGAAVLDALDA